jgi:hypothetical protein
MPGNQETAQPVPKGRQAPLMRHLGPGRRLPVGAPIRGRLRHAPADRGILIHHSHGTDRGDDEHIPQAAL